MIMLATAAFATPVVRGQCNSDDFNLPDGSPPDPGMWLTDQDCDMGNVVIDTQGGKLHQYGVYATQCTSSGGPGLGVYSVTAFDCFDVQIVYQGSTGPGYGYWSFGVLCAADVPWGSNTTSAGFTGFSGGPPGVVASMNAAGHGSLGNTPPVNPGDTLRITGVPGGALEFYINGALLNSLSTWNPPCSTFAAVVYSRPGGTVGEDRHTYWDDFSLCFPCSGLVLSAPIPGVSCTLNRMDATGATPSATVYLTYGLQGGVTPVPGCTGLTIDILQPMVAGSVLADSSGTALFLGYVPCGAAGRTILFQAVELQSCRRSNLISHLFQ